MTDTELEVILGGPYTDAELAEVIGRADLSAEKAERVRDLIPYRDAVGKLLRGELGSCPWA